MDVGRSSIVFDRMRAAVTQLNYSAEDQDSTMSLGESDRENVLQGTYLRDVVLRSFKSHTPPSEAEMDTEIEASQTEPQADSGSEDTPFPSLDGIFEDDFRIHSWATRFSRPDPIAVEGDPVLPLNATQTQAVAMMVKNRISLVQGVCRSNLILKTLFIVL